MSDAPGLGGQQDNAPGLGTIYLIAPDGEGYSHTDSFKMAQALIAAAGYKRVSKAEYEQVKALIDARSGDIPGDE